MNERIQELAEKSGAFHASGFAEVPSEFCLVDEGIEKFAELIIRECVAACESVTKEGEPLHLVSLGYSHKIKEHFGVE